MQTARHFYRPSREDKALLQTAFPRGNADNPSWHQIEAELVARGHDRAELMGQKAPTLLRFLERPIMRLADDNEKNGPPVPSTRKRRTALGVDTETKVLVASARRCCLCFGLNHDRGIKEGQLAHLDDNPANNKPDNLAWLCLDHHGQWHRRGNMTKGLTKHEVKAHRTSLYKAVQAGGARWHARC
ncbi:MAG: hypothetical protein QM770_07570 [Tepidisphaeraceae bacterium]